MGMLEASQLGMSRYIVLSSLMLVQRLKKSLVLSWTTIEEDTFIEVSNTVCFLLAVKNKSLICFYSIRLVRNKIGTFQTALLPMLSG